MNTQEYYNYCRENRGITLWSGSRRIPPYWWEMVGDRRYNLVGVINLDGYYCIGELTPLNDGAENACVDVDGKELSHDIFCTNEAQIDVAPFISVRIYYPIKTGLKQLYPQHKYLDMPIAKGVRTKNGIYWSNNSSDSYVAFVSALCGSEGIELCHIPSIIKRISEEAKGYSEMSFFHLITKCGYGHEYYARYRYDDLLNMNPMEFGDLEQLKKECKDIPIIKKSLNFSIFERPLTDEERLECAERFFKEYIYFKTHNKQIRNYATC